MQGRYWMAPLGAVALAMGSPAAAVEVYTSQGAYTAAHAGTASNFGSADVSGTGSLKVSSTTFSTSCSDQGTCLYTGGNVLYAANGDVGRHCENAIPDRAAAAFGTCLADHQFASQWLSDGGEPSFIPSNYPPSVLGVSSASPFVGFLLSGSGQRSVDYVVNGVSGTLTLAGTTFVGFADGSPIDATFTTDGLLRVSTVFDSVPSPAPEPASWAMMLVGFAAAGSALRRKRSPRLRLAPMGA